MKGFTLREELKESASDLYRLNALGIDLDAIAEKLPMEGISAFAASLEKLLVAVEEKRKRVMAGAGSHAERKRN